MLAQILDDAGSGRPLVYVPGIDGSGELLLGTAERLRESFRLVCLRYAFEPERPATYAALAESVAGCIASLGVPRALLLAESFGVAVALQTALDHERSVAGLALVNGFAHYRSRARIALSRILAPLLPESLFPLCRNRFARYTLFHPRRDETALARFHALRGTWFDSAYRTRLRMIQELDLRPRLNEVDVPVMIFAADKDQVVDSMRAAKVMRAGLSQATLHVVRDAGHLILPLESEPWVERMQTLSERAGL